MKGILPLHLKVCLNLLDGAFGKVLQPSEVNPIVLNSSFKKKKKGKRIQFYGVSLSCL